MEKKDKIILDAFLQIKVNDSYLAAKIRARADRLASEKISLAQRIIVWLAPRVLQFAAAGVVIALFALGFYFAPTLFRQYSEMRWVSGGMDFMDFNETITMAGQRSFVLEGKTESDPLYRMASFTLFADGRANTQTPILSSSMPGPLAFEIIDTHLYIHQFPLSVYITLFNPPEAVEIDMLYITLFPHIAFEIIDNNTLELVQNTLFVTFAHMLPSEEGPSRFIYDPYYDGRTARPPVLSLSTRPTP